MSTAEIKQHIDQMTEEERFFAAAYLQHLAQSREPAHQRLLADRMARMDKGRKVSLEQARRVHQTLEAEGL